MSIYNSIASDLSKFKGVLQCSTCGKEIPLLDEDISSYLAHGWPMCCGFTMTWITENKINEGK